MLQPEETFATLMISGEQGVIRFSSMKKLFRHLHIKPELAVEFIATFSRFEYALKSTTYCRGTNRVDAAWNRFATDIDSKFNAINCKKLKEASRYLLTNPPKKQVRDNNELKFVDNPVNSNDCRTQQLITMVNTVRNNLFHGGKFCRDGEQDAGRNERLVNASLIILNHCYSLEPEVKTSFEQ